MTTKEQKRKAAAERARRHYSKHKDEILAKRAERKAVQDAPAAIPAQQWEQEAAAQERRRKGAERARRHYSKHKDEILADKKAKRDAAADNLPVRRNQDGIIRDYRKAAKDGWETRRTRPERRRQWEAEQKRGGLAAQDAATQDAAAQDAAAERVMESIEQGKALKKIGQWRKPGTNAENLTWGELRQQLAEQDDSGNC